MKVDRLVSIIMILLDKERVGARELADMFEVSPRTIYRDIEAINMAGIIFSFGDKCECLEPPHIRAEMKRRINGLAAGAVYYQSG